MKNFFSVLLLFISINVYSQNIDSVSVTPILCNGDSTCVTVYTDDTSGFVFYDLYIFNPSINNWMHHPNYPVLGSSQITLCDLTAGTKRIVTSNSTVGLIDSLDFVINQPDPIQSIQTVQNVSCFGGSDGQVDILTFLGTPPYNYVFNNGLTGTYSGSVSVSGFSSGSYTYTITDNNGCSFNNNPVTVNITNPPSLTIANTSTINVSCFGGNNGRANVAVSGGTQPYTYLWSNGQTSATATSLTAGSYSCTITDANGCVVTTQSLNVFQPSAISLNFGSVSHVSCLGGSNGFATISVTGGTSPYSYLWSNGQTSSTATNLSAGNYSCVITDDNGCSTTSGTLTIVEPDSAITVDTIITDVSCNGGNDGSITILVSGGNAPYTYLWSTGSTTNSINNLLAGVYSCSVTDLNGCIVNVSTIIVEEPEFPISLSVTVDSISCNGGSDGTATIIASGGTEPYSYQWSNGMTTPFVDSLSFGVYSCTVTDDNGCSVISQNFVVHQPLTISTTLSITNITCNSQNDGTVSATAAGGNSPYQYYCFDEFDNLIDSGQTIGGLSIGNYYVLVVDNNLCTDTSNFTITQPVALSITSILTSAVSCNSGADGTAIVNVAGGTTPYSFLWSNGATNNLANNLTAGVYSCTVTDANGCTISSNNISIDQPQTALSVNEIITNVSCYQGSNGVANLTASGGSSPYSFIWDNGQNTSTITGLSQGAYYYSLTDSNGCVLSDSIFVSHPNQINNNITFTDVSCFGGSDATATAMPTGGTPPYSYLWNISPVSNLPTITQLPIGNYQLTVTDSLGCISSSNVIIGQPNQLSATANINDVSCNGGSNGEISLNINGGNPYSIGPNYTILWSDGQSTNPAINLTSGFHNVIITDSTNCSVSYTYTVNEPTYPLNVNLNVENVSCNGYNDGIITATPTGGTPPYNYFWPNGQNSQALTLLFAGSYNVIVTDSNGCNVNGVANVLEPSAMSFSYSSLPSTCFDYNDGAISLTVTGGTAPYTYLWSTGETTSNAANLAAGSYSAVVIDSNNCTLSTGLLNVIEPPQIQAILNSTSLLCYGDSNAVITVASVAGSSPPYSYLWSTGQNTPIIGNLGAGNYNVSITDGGGCSNTFTTTISQPSQITSTFNTTNITVTGANNGTITSFPSGGTPPYSYSWSGPNNFTSSSNTINNLHPGVYTLTVTDGQFCTQIFTQIITEPNCNIIIDSTYISPTCFGNLAQISWTNTNGLPPYSNTLINSNGIYATSINGSLFTTTNNPVQLPVGVWQLVVVDAAGCAGILNLPVTSPDSISVSLNINDVSCYGLNDGNVIANISGGTPPYTIDWGGVNANQLYSGNYNMIVTDANGCSSGLINFTVSQPDPLIIDSVITTKVSCVPGNDGTAAVYTSGGNTPYNYFWNNGQVTQTAINLVTGTYTVNVTDNKGCSVNSGIIDINNADPLTINISENSILCNGGSDGSLTASLNTGTGPLTYSWFDLNLPSLVISSDSVVDNLSSGNYSILAVDQNGCITQQNYFLSEPNNLQFSLFSNNITLNGAGNGSINTTSVSGGTAPYSYFWVGPNGYSSVSANIVNLQAGLYTLTVTDANGCSFSGTSVINEPNCNVQITENIVQPLCYGQNGTLSWTNNGGGLPYNNTLTNLSNNQIYYNSNYASSLFLADGNYSLVVEDQFGCLDMVNITIQSPDLLIANISSTDATCFNASNGTVVVSPLGGTAPYTLDFGGVNPNALSAGTYAVTVTDVNGCSTSGLSYSINEPNDINVSATTTPVSCNNGTNGTAFAIANGGTAPYNYLWSPSGSTNQFISNLTSGNYFVSVTDINGCSPSTGPLTVNINQPLSPIVINAVSTDASCFGYSDGTAQVFASGGSGPYTFLWSNGFTTDFISGLSSGTYSCIVNDINNCATTTTVTINQPDEIFANIQTTNVSCYGGNDASALVNPTGGTGTYNIIWFNNTNNYSVNGLSIGTYSVFVSDNSGCSTANNPNLFNITQPDSLDLNAFVSQTVSCVNGSDGSLSSHINGGTRPYSYSWFDSTNVLISTDSFANNLSEGQYLLIAVDINGCIDSSSVYLGSASEIIANFTISSVSCIGGSDGSLTINPSGGTPPYSYSWSSTGSTTNSSIGLSAGITYYVSVSDANGCAPSIFSSNVPEPAVLEIDSFTSLNPSCHSGNDGSIVINNITGGTSPYSLFWSNSQFGNTANNLSSGNIGLVIVDGNGCIDSSFSFTLSQPTQIISNLSVLDSVTCYNGNNGSLISSPFGGTGNNYQFLWSDSTTNNVLDSINVGSYSVTITDSLGCQITDSIYLGSIFNLSLNFITNPVSCIGTSTGSTSVQVFGGTPPFQYLWNNGNTTQFISGLSAGSYTCLVVDSNGCEIIGTTDVTQSATTLIIDSIYSSNLTCNSNNSGFAGVFVSGGAGGYNYQWDDINSQTTQEAINLYADTFTVNITDSANCTISQTFVITEPNAVMPIINVSNIDCFGNANGSIDLNNIGGTAPYNIYWDGPNSFTSSSSNLSSLEKGYYYLIISDSNECNYFDTIYINEPDPLSLIVDVQNPLCYNDSNGIVSVKVSGGTQPYTGFMGTIIPSYPSNDSIVFNNLTAGSNTLSVVDTNGCDNDVQVLLINPTELLIVSDTLINPSCYGYSNGSIAVTTIGGTLPYSYELKDSNGNLVSSSSQSNNLVDGSYDLLINDLNNCQLSKNYIITEPDEILITLNDLVDVLCFGESTE